MSTDIKALALRLVQGAIDSSPEDILALTTADATWWISGTTELSGTYTVKEVFEYSGKLFCDLKEPFTGGVTSVTAEENRVSIETWGHAEFKDGRVYHNEVHILLTFRDDKIASIREYGDTALLQSLFSGIDVRN